MGDASEKCLETLATLLKQPHIEPAKLETAMRSCVRYTQDHSAACRFANMGGISGLLNLKSSSSFAGVEAMAVMLIRHVFENQATLTLAMQSIMCRFSSHDKLQAMLTTSVGRSRNLFAEILKSSMQIKEEGGGMEFVGKVAFLKLDDMCQESKATTTKLLDALPALVKERQSKKIFNAEKLLLLLAELSRLCPPVAQLILDHRYQPGHSDVVTHDCSAIEFIMANAEAFDDSNHMPDAITTLIMFMIQRQAKQVLPRLLTQLVAALKQALSRQQSTDNQERIKAIITVMDTSICFARHCSSEDNWSVVIKAIEESKLLDSLAQMICSIDLSTVQAAIGARAILNTLNLFFGQVSQHQLGKSDAPAHDEYDLADQGKAIFSRMRGQCGHRCTLPHLSSFRARPLLGNREATNGNANNTWNFDWCCYSNSYSSRFDLFHDSSKALFITEDGSERISYFISRFQRVPCTGCRWYQECCLVQDGPVVMRLNLRWTIRALENRHYEHIQAIKKQFVKSQIDAREEHQVRLLERLKLAQEKKKNNQEEPSKAATAPAPKEIFKLTDGQRAILGDGPLPDGLGPAILVELPEDIRREVIAQQVQLNNQTARQRNEAHSNAQERATNDTDQIILFIESLLPEVRRQVLTEMPDNQLRLLPDHLVAEVHRLRDSAIMHEMAYQENFGEHPRRPQRRQQQLITRKLLNERSLASLLSLLLLRGNIGVELLATGTKLFEPLCGHLPTRRWLIEALLGIIKRTKESPMQPSDGANLATEKLWYVDPTLSQASPGSGIRFHLEDCNKVCGKVLDLLNALSIWFPDLLTASYTTTLSSANFFDLLAELKGVKASTSSSKTKSKER